MQQPNWLLILIIGAILSIPMSLLTNLVTPHIQDWIDKRVLSGKGKKLKRLEQEYARVKRLHDDPALLSITVAHRTISSLSFLVSMMLALVGGQLVLSTAGVLDDWFASVLYLLAFVGGVLFSNRLSSVSRDLTRLREFDQYKSDIMAEINRIQEQGASVVREGVQADDPTVMAQGELIIRNATYGAEGHREDVTQLLISRVSGDKLRLRVSNDELGGDPIKGAKKELRVDYIYRGQQHSALVPENDILSLP